MGEDPLPKLRKFCTTFRGFGKSKKRNILIVTILVLATSLFFSVFFHPKALAEKNEQPVQTADVRRLDPMEKVGQSFPEKLEAQKKESGQKLCEDVKAGSDKKNSVAEAIYRNTVSGHPMEAMVPFIAQKDKTVAAFLIGIAKKESDWGTHSPKKNGRDCYNYWGYRGGYNRTESGYSCFDNPEQAVDVVGGRIQELLAEKINTPARMVVWKCGNSCSGHDPVAVKKWISDVSLYYYRLES